MNKKVLIVSSALEQEKEAFDELKSAGLGTVLLAEKEREGFTEKDLIAYWNQLEEKPSGLLMGGDIALGREFARQAEGLKYISLNSVGYDHLDWKAFYENGITICNVQGQNSPAVADMAWGLILCVMRRIAEGDRNMRQGNWCDGIAKGLAVSKKTIGIIGFGAIGQEVAKRAVGFDMKILYCGPAEKPEAKKYHAEYAELDQALRESDIIVIACPLKAETYHMIDQDRLNNMKENAVLINIARGGIVDMQALYEALKNRKIAGAGLDVYEKEPLYKSPLFQLDNVVMTPHMGGMSDREMHNVVMQAAKNMVILMQGGKTGTEIIKK